MAIVPRGTAAWSDSDHGLGVLLNTQEWSRHMSETQNDGQPIPAPASGASSRIALPRIAQRAVDQRVMPRKKGKTRRFAQTLVFLGLLAPLGGAMGHCVSAEDRATAGLLALRNQMIVVALSCGRHAEYNQFFVLPFRPLLQANDRAVVSYFRGRESAKDAFVTDMVNVMSQDASRMGKRFCARGDQLFSEISAMRSREQLLSYAASQNLLPPELGLCALNRRL